MSTSTTVPEGSEPRGGGSGGGRGPLRRDIGRTGLLFASIGSMIGSGWLFGALDASQQAGPAAVLSWALGGVMILLIGLVYAELGTMFPLSGGVVRYPHLAFGGFASYTTGWITWVACATVAPIEVEGALQYATRYAPFTSEHQAAGGSVYTLTGLGYALAVVLLAVFVVVNAVGVRWFARINNALVWWKLAVIVIVIAAFLVAAHHGGNWGSHGFAPGGVEGVFSAISTSGIVFSYLGFRQGIELAGETSDPRRNVPLAVVGSVVLVTAVYVLLQVAFIGAVSPGDLDRSGGWATLDFADDFGPLAAVATILGLTWLAVLLYADAVISPADTGLIYTTVTARISYAMARNGNAPRALARTTPRGAPLVSLLVTFLVGLVVFLPFPSWQQLVGFITSATVLSFGSGPLVLAALRRQLPEAERPFRLPGGHTIPLLAFWASNLAVYWAGWTTDWKLFVAILLGFVVLAVFRATGSARLEDVRSGATWLLPWLGGLALVSWLGDYGGGLGVLGAGVGVGVLAVLSAAVYALALRVRLPVAEVRRHVASAQEESAHEAGQGAPAAG